MADETKPNRSQLRPQDYERIGRLLESVVATGYLHRRRLIAANFLRGLFFGLGATIGLTIVLASLVYLLTFFSDLPLIGRLLDSITQTIEKSR